ncbi:beta-xylosidase [Acidicapsa dinghuensis]|uniref:Beta-xylosidase n=1 Tax=Acidicapsa dinghuensis TaxID=2218256 RepID=A0ABW1EP70_9BACT|nr:beta-xylosidase [Acidicapsa dinghuensis]
MLRKIKLIVVFGLACFSAGAGLAQRPVAIRVEAGHTIGPYDRIWTYFGADEPNYTYAPNGQKLLRELGELSPAPVYFRTHNLFTTGDGDGSLKWGSTNVYTEKADGTPVYNWTITDRIFDAFAAAHVRPLVEIGFMPEALSTHPEPYRHTFPKGDIFTGWTYPPKDYAKWGALVRAYAEHMKQRYGSAVDGWLWEVWNEPDIPYWYGTAEEYDRLYDVTSAAIREALPNAKIGGPESTGVASSHAETFLRQFLEHCAHGKNAATGATGAPLDFISFHPKGRPSTVDGHVRMDIGFQLRAVERGMKVVASYPEWKNTPIILGENDPEGCAACQGAANGYRNGALYGVSEAEVMARIAELARRYDVHVQGTVTWAFEFENQPYFAGFRELATNGVDKPVLNVFRMMGMLGGEQVQVESSGALSLDDMLQGDATGAGDIDAIATRQGNEVSILVWNYADDDVLAPDPRVTLKIAGLGNGSVQEEEFRMDKNHSNAYTVWQSMGSPAQPTPEQQKKFEEAGGLERISAPHAMQIQEGNAAVEITLPRQGVTLIRLSR